MSVRGLASAAIKYYCITYQGKVQNDEFVRTVTIRQRFPPTSYHAFTVARNDFLQFARRMGSIDFVRVTSVSSGPCSGFSTGSSTPSGPNAPTNLSATADSNSIVLTWDAVSGATSYNVKRSTNSGGPYSNISTGVAATTYDDTTAVVGTTYYYVVTAVNSNGEGSASNEASAVIISTPIDLSGLAVWLKADADVYSDTSGTTPATNGQEIADWEDQSGNAVDVKSLSVGLRPVYVTNVVNGKPVARCSSAQFVASLDATGFTKSQPITIVAVVQFTTTSTGFFVGSAVGGNLVTNPNVGVGASSGAPAARMGGASVSGGTISANQFHTLRAIINGASSQLAVDSVVQSTGNIGSNAWQVSGSNIVVGSWGTSGKFNGDIAEIAFYDRVLNSAELVAIETYLETKYGL